MCVENRKGLFCCIDEKIENVKVLLKRFCVRQVTTNDIHTFERSIRNNIIEISDRKIE